MKSRFITLIPSHLICYLWVVFILEMNAEERYKSSGKETESCLVFTSSTKREIKHFHVVVVQRRLRNVQKSVMHVQCKVVVVCHCRRRCLSALIRKATTPHRGGRKGGSENRGDTRLFSLDKHVPLNRVWFSDQGFA